MVLTARQGQYKVFRLNINPQYPERQRERGRDRERETGRETDRERQAERQRERESKRKTQFMEGMEKKKIMSNERDT